MKIIKAKVVSDISPTEDGSFWVETGKAEAARVTYSSPTYNVNNGGIFSPPTVDSYVLLFENESPQDGEAEFYYVATIVDDVPLTSEARIPEFKAVRGAGSTSVYDKNKRPTGMTVANSDGQGLIVKSDLSNNKRENYVALEAETGASISAGEQGCQIVNEHEDGITVQGQPNGLFPYRSISMTAQGPILQEAGASFNITVGKGGDDINISNLANTLDLGGCGLSAGNIRIHSQNKDITLRTGSTGAIANPLATRNINIIAPGAEIQVNGTTGGIVIRSIGSGGITFESTTTLDLNAPSIALNGVVTMAGGIMSVDPAAGSVAINAATQLDLFSAGAVNITGSTSVGVNGAAVSVLGTSPPVVGYPGASPTDMVPYAKVAPVIVPPVMLPLPEVPSLVVENSYGDTPIV